MRSDSWCVGDICNVQRYFSLNHGLSLPNEGPRRYFLSCENNIYPWLKVHA